jgi:hypothetical protein
MAALVAVIHVFELWRLEGVDTRHKSGHDGSSRNAFWKQE